MKKISALFIILVLSSFVINGQEKVKELVSDQYDRNGLATMLVTYGDNQDQNIRTYFDAINKGDKFDVDQIPQKNLRVNHSRGTAAATRSNAIASHMNSNDYGKEIVSWLYSRDADGMMNASRVLERGHYNATEDDILRMEGTKQGREALGDIGFQLIANNYVLVIDYWSIKRTSDKKKVSWSVAADAYLYRINYSDEISEQIFDCWIDEDDTPESAQEKRERFDALRIGTTLVMTASTTQSYDEDDGGMKAAVVAAYNKLMYQLEEGNDAWLVKAAIYRKKPVRAKIGTKEGLKNGMRFDAYRYEQREDGKLTSKRKGILRATTIASNKGVAEKDSPASEFYQIAGGKLEEGMVLRQKNDLKMFVSAGYRDGGLKGINVKVDNLTKIGTRGTSQYVLIDVTGWGYNIDKYYEKQGGGRPSGDPSFITAVDVGIGYGIGFRASRYVEIVPHALVGIGFLFSENDADALVEATSDEESFFDKAGFFATVGLKFNINVYYPVQIFGGVDASFSFGANDVYLRNYEVLKSMDKTRSGVGIFGGIRIAF